ncbi:Membrane proteinase PrsW, cleaves anti-sigma factor RsiW, M82 family [Austwickia chelonae]|uniref:PrsW family intramembrane metalloprotease n=1 Tax=Austwickia chelonae NBRC 105200 TaxID=1184607 RepID=K6VU26_9MICO|nr:PrsW family intramembrane metalloprotease [Austwickia chelonae]GAB78845.1 hypothetical protein AUCHE_17_00570 [Austwickia chelonae NBRC 105200]SEV85208.1 Membrane proteinase PrsW, cleaves anti-sigma factor RsiW, M82 family [Austwickia chelonae]
MSTPNSDLLGDRPARYGHEFFRPASALWWLYLTGCVVCGVCLVVYFGPSLSEAKFSVLILLPVHVIASLTLTWIMLRCDPYRARRPWIMLAAFACGATFTTYSALAANKIFNNFLIHIFDESTIRVWHAAMVGPTTEEWTKMTGTLVIMLVAKDTLTRPIHGLMVGAFVGLGFQICENIAYGVNNAISGLEGDLSQAALVTFSRSLTGLNSHNLYGAITGVGVAVLLGRIVGKPWSRSRRIAGFAGFYALAWSLHFSWNSSGGAPQAFLLVVPVVTGTVAFTALAFILRWVWRQERLYLTEAATQVTGNKLTELHQAAIGTRKTRKTYLKQLKKTHGKTAAKTAHTDMHTYLEHLQAWARRHTGIDEHTYPTPTPTTPTTPNPLDDDTLYLTAVPQLR